ncbi:MAG: hypothetical protein AAFN74_05270 [Myxococcota bacterium]
MEMWSQVRAQLLADGRRIVRDQFLVGLVVYILVVSFVVRWMLPWLTARFAAQVQLVAYYPLISGYLVLTSGAVVCGVIGGLLLLETREEGTLNALRVSPMPMTRLLALETGFVFVVTIPLVILEAVIIDAGLPKVVPLFIITCAAAAFAPVVAVGVAALARDKVEAFAWMKVMGFFALLPVAAWFVPEPWQWGAVIVPPYPAVKAWWLANAGDPRWVVWAALAPVINALALLGFVYRWKKTT